MFYLSLIKMLLFDHIDPTFTVLRFRNTSQAMTESSNINDLRCKPKTPPFPRTYSWKRIGTFVCFVKILLDKHSHVCLHDLALGGFQKSVTGISPNQDKKFAYNYDV